MALKMARNWEDEISAVTGGSRYQSCTIQIVDPLLVEGGEYDVDTDTYGPITNDGVVYSGQARYIPVRAGAHQGGEAQANSTTIRSVRFQIPKNAGPVFIRKGLTVNFTSADRNPALVGRTAKVGDDFQGSSAATRTIHASMDIDSGVNNGN